MKNPNRYGTITKLSGNRRKPYIVKEGQSGLQRPIGYCATREEALILLAEYNQTPWNLDGEQVTLKQLFEQFLKAKNNKLGFSTIKGLKSAYIHIKHLENNKYLQIKQCYKPIFKNSIC